MSTPQTPYKKTSIHIKNYINWILQREILETLRLAFREKLNPSTLRHLKDHSGMTENSFDSLRQIEDEASKLGQIHFPALSNRTYAMICNLACCNVILAGVKRVESI